MISDAVGRLSVRTIGLSAGLLLVTGLLVALMPAGAEESDKVPVPFGLPPVDVPEDNPMSAAKIELGKALFFDRRLSIDDTVSCADCHDPKKGWSNGARFATGVKGQKGGRSSPTILNAAYGYFQFWDGRAGSLEEQAVGPIMNPIEMAMPDGKAVEKKLARIDGYRPLFRKAFGNDEITIGKVGKAIAAFERTVLSGDAPYDRYKAGDKSALSESAQRGMALFFGKGSCSACHVPPHFTDLGFHNVGVGMAADKVDAGRAAISKLEGDHGAFKTPTLRDIARTGPYMHDGSLKTLEDVVAHYDKGGVANPQLDEEIFPLKFSAKEKADLVTFLKEGLGSSKYPQVAPPTLPK